MNSKGNEKNKGRHAPVEGMQCALILEPTGTNGTKLSIAKVSLPLYHYPSLQSDNRVWSSSTTMVTPEPFPHGTRSLRCL